MVDGLRRVLLLTGVVGGIGQVGDESLQVGTRGNAVRRENLHLHAVELAVKDVVGRERLDIEGLNDQVLRLDRVPEEVIVVDVVDLEAVVMENGFGIGELPFILMDDFKQSLCCRLDRADVDICT